MKTLAFILLVVTLAACSCIAFSLAPALLAAGRIELALLVYLAPMIAISVTSLTWIFMADTSWQAPHKRSGERLPEGRCPVPSTQGMTMQGATAVLDRLRGIALASPASYAAGVLEVVGQVETLLNRGEV